VIVALCTFSLPLLRVVPGRRFRKGEQALSSSFGSHTWRARQREEIEGWQSQRNGAERIYVRRATAS
jgi:hypothetical protein